MLAGDARPLKTGSSANLAYMIYTSGSTGKPKGAMNEHRSIVNRLLWMQEQYRLTEGDVVLQKTPFSFDVSVWEFFWPLITGARLVIAQPGGHRDPSYLVRLIQAYKVTVLHFVPSMLRVFAETSGVEQCSTLRAVICSGEALPPDLVDAMHARSTAQIHNLYGPTEAAVDVTYWHCPRVDHTTIVPIGRPVANTQCYVLDDHLRILPVGFPGELHLGGIQVGRGYHNRPELTAEKFIPDPFRGEPEARLYRTGDLCRYLPDGSIEYLGRIDHQVKIRGFRIELGEIENLLAQHPNIKEAVVMAREDTPGDKRLVAYIVPRISPPPTGHEMAVHIKRTLPEFMLPASFVVLAQLPLSPNGKADRKALPKPEAPRPRNPGAHVQPTTELEKQIAAIWCEVLSVPRVDIHDNFFDIGGQSLKLMRVHQRLREQMAQEVPIVALFQHPTVGALSTFLARKDSAAARQDDLLGKESVQDRAQRQRDAMLRQQALREARRNR